MQEYKFEIINARFIASGVAIQAKDSLTGCDRTKGGTRRKRGLQARDAARLRDGGGTTEGGAAIKQGRGEVGRERRLLAWPHRAYGHGGGESSGRVCF